MLNAEADVKAEAEADLETKAESTIILKKKDDMKIIGKIFQSIGLPSKPRILMFHL